MSTDTDIRYTAEAIAAMSDDELGRHRDAREEQLARAHRDMSMERNVLDRCDDPDSATFQVAMANLASYTREHAEQRRIVRLLECEVARRRTATLAARTAQEGRPVFELIDAENARRGMPCSLEEAGDDDLAAELWRRAVMYLENETDDGTVTNGDAAHRVADAYAIIAGIAAIAS